MDLLPKALAMACNGALAVPDILERIFSLTIHQPSEDEKSFAVGNRRLTTANAPWPFLLVCKHWNNIVSSTPSLWSTIVLVLKYSRYGEIARSLPFLEAHLRRSQNVPLTLVVCISIGTFIPVRGTVQDRRDPAVPLYELLGILMYNQRRWQDVVLNIQANANAPPGQAYRSFPMDFTIRFEDMDVLKKLSVSFHSRPKYRGTQQLELAHCPQLEQIELVGQQGILLFSPDVRGFLPNLNTIICNPDDLKAYATYWTLLGLSTNAQHLQLVFYRDSRNIVAVDLPLIELPRLQSLSLKMNFDDAIQALERISLPALAKLELDDIILCDEALMVLADQFRKLPLTHLKLRLREEGEGIQHGLISKVHLFSEWIATLGAVETQIRL